MTNIVTVTLNPGSWISLPTVDKYGDGHLTVDLDKYRIQVYCQYTHQREVLGFSITPVGCKSRVAYGDEFVDGPFGQTWPCPSAVSLYQYCPELIINASPGAVFILADTLYELVDDNPLNYPRLVAVVG